MDLALYRSVGTQRKLPEHSVKENVTLRVTLCSRWKHGMSNVRYGWDQTKLREIIFFRLYLHFSMRIPVPMRPSIGTSFAITGTCKNIFPEAGG